MEEIAANHVTCLSNVTTISEAQLIEITRFFLFSGQLCCHDHGHQSDHRVRDVTAESWKHLTSQVSTLVCNVFLAFSCSVGTTPSTIYLLANFRSALVWLLFVCGCSHS